MAVPAAGQCKEFDLAFDAQKQRKIMSRFATGVTVASTVVDGETWGMTANAVTSLSLTPPLVLLAVVRGTPSHHMFTHGRCFALNILAADQQDLSIRFSSPGPKDFSELETHTAVTGRRSWSMRSVGSTARLCTSCRAAITTCLSARFWMVAFAMASRCSTTAAGIANWPTETWKVNEPRRR